MALRSGGTGGSDPVHRGHRSRSPGNGTGVDDSDGAELQIPFEGNTLVSVDGPDVESAVHIAENGVGWDALKEALGQ